jgi:hypothetical protein
MSKWTDQELLELARLLKPLASLDDRFLEALEIGIRKIRAARARALETISDP